MNKKDYNRLVTLYKSGHTPAKTITELILYHCLRVPTENSVLVSEDRIQIAAINIDRFYKEEVE